MPQKIFQDGSVTTVNFNVCSGWEYWFLLISDVHFDSIYSNRNLLETHLEKLKKKNGKLLVFGDWFDAMQGRFDPRRSMDELRPEYRREDYYDFVVQDSRDFLLKYSDNILLLSDGNHELSVLKNANTNLMDRLVFSLNDKKKTRIIHGGFGGWIRLMFQQGKGTEGNRTSKKIKYFHGSGGDAPVTRGVIQTNRQSVYLPDADVVVNGHSHNHYHVAIERERISSQGKLFFDLQHHIRIPGYKQSYGDGSGGWDVTRGSPPKPIGAMWLKFSWENKKVKIDVFSDISPSEPISVNSNAIYDQKIYDDDREGV